MGNNNGSFNVKSDKLKRIFGQIFEIIPFWGEKSHGQTFRALGFQLSTLRLSQQNR